MTSWTSNIGLMRENTDQKKLRIWTLFTHSSFYVRCLSIWIYWLPYTFIFACKIWNQMHAKFKERKVPWGAQKWLLWKAYALYNICFIIFDQSLWKILLNKLILCKLKLIQNSYYWMLAKLVSMAINLLSEFEELFTTEKLILIFIDKD